MDAIPLELNNASSGPSSADIAFPPPSQGGRLLMAFKEEGPQANGRSLVLPTSASAEWVQ